MFNVMIVDDHSLIRKGIRLLLKNNTDFNVTMEAATGEEALQKLYMDKVEIMLLDLSMPGVGGLAIIEQAKRMCADLRILILSMHEDENYIRQAMLLGASGYIPKASADDELLDALRTVASGRFYLSKNAEQSLLTSMFSGLDGDGRDPVKCLSHRELEVFEYMVHGYTITEIGKLLNLSVKTIDTHKTKIMEKLGCKKRNELVKLALQYNLLKTEL
ncbi:MAG: response regulator transcription factor [Megasphaera sp.]|nr:response regulator transcription factor [Megasphaera sp.]